MTTEPADKHRKNYGRGFYDGLRSAGVNNPEQFMNEAKLAKQEQALNGAAKKVLDAVPINEPWTLQQITAEIRRGGSTMGAPIIEACVRNCVDRGLVKETGGLFVRSVAKPKIHVVETAKPAEQAQAPAPAQETPPARKDTIDRMIALSAAAREAADRITALAKEIEDVAIEVEERIVRIQADTEKLRQLQALLKSINN